MTAVGGPIGGARQSGAPLVAYALIQVVVITVSALVTGPAGPVLNLVAEAIAVGALAYGVLHRRPAPRAAWLALAASMTLLLAAGVALGVLNRLDNSQNIQSRLPTALATLGQLGLVVALTLLSRRLIRRGAADALDALMTALGVYLVLWAALIEPALRYDTIPVSTAVALPIGTLLVFTTGLRLVFGGGLRDPAIALVLAGTALLLLTFGILSSLALHTGELRVYTSLAPLGSAYFAAFGAAGLHPDLDRVRPLPPAGETETSRKRIVLFVVLCLVPAAVGAVEVLRLNVPVVRNPAILVVPLIASSIFLLVLVTRLALSIVVAQRRSHELARSLAEQEELQRQLAYRALHDPLTGLHNRIVLTDAIERALDDPRDAGRQALLLLDLDHFKDINDTLGHPLGDQLLVEVAHRLRRLTPTRATLSRLGGDEFAVFVEGADTPAALELAERFRSRLRLVYDIGGRELFVTTSVGVLVTDRRSARPTQSDLLRDADLALYAAKSAGKDRVTLFHPELRTARLDHARISAGLRQALTNDELVLHYQPVVDLVSGGVVAVEALLRWRDEGGRLLPPNEFIPVAEDTGQIEPIGAWALHRALHDDRRWFTEQGVAVAVNVSARQLTDPDFASMVLAVLRDQDLPGHSLILEITESSLVGTSQTAARAHLDRLREHGVRVAIDDFGTGYSSLSYVAHLPVDIVKVDKSFTQALGSPDVGGQDWAFTRAILQMVASLDMQAIAEGVETAEQAEALRILRCPLVQGFHYSRPVPADVIDRVLGRPTPLAAPSAAATPSSPSPAPTSVTIKGSRA